MARPGSPRLAKGARLARLPHPPGARSQWLLVAGPRLSRQAGTRENKAGRTKNVATAEGWGLPRLPGAQRRALRCPSAAPRAEANPEAVTSGTKYKTASPSRAASRGEWRPARAASPSSPCPGTAAPSLPSQPQARRSLRSRAGVAPGPRHCRSRGGRTAALGLG